MEYPEQDARLSMLRLLHDLLEEARAQGHARHGKLWLAYYPDEVDRPARLEVYEPRFDVAGRLGISGDEAYGRLRDLYNDRYLNLSFDSSGPDAGGMVGVAFTEKGRAAIRKLPDPHTEVLRRLDAIAAAIEGLQGVDPEQKTLAKKAVGELKTFARGLSPAAAMELAKQIAAAAGG